ncbi:GNAT family N-acetyltransferase [Tropicibacter sp. R15_0]|uniref:GNAT family N-acetyltransferase n=1 Tax=Tropicibacter sp. R15_0 TaxID=2821101 RepID=UPI001ADB8923|nr:GNAT family N-acetyltransferase [Tropicibacter sp. R15_0]MBO9466385.1 GNAT family N-acetyltransferase [Tropicibacter sp. R15_0]
MLRLATAQDVAALDTFLAHHAESSMFLRSNLAAHGTDERDHRHGTRFFIWGEIEGVFGATVSGFLLVQAPNCPPEAFAAFAHILDQERALGMTGPDDQVAQALTALGLTTARYQLNHAEPLYRLDLAHLPEGRLPMRLPQPQDLDFLVDWFSGYLVDTQQNIPDNVVQPARDRAQIAVDTQSIRLLLQGGQPVAMAAINASVADHVQVGGVFVPQDQRQKGLGRGVTTALLQEARDDGAKIAILFANNPPAARAYEAIGFQKVGDFRVAILAEPTAVTPQPNPARMR